MSARPTRAEVVREYCDLRAKYGKPVEVRNWSRFGPYCAWCAGHGLDPVLFMRQRFARAAPSGHLPTISTLISSTLLKAWREYGDEGHAHEARRQEDLVAASGDAFSQEVKALRQPALRAQEAFKERHLVSGTPETCLAAPEHHSGGYDPRSPTCIRCPMAQRCAERLDAAHGFNVALLRLGRISELPRAVASAAIR